MFIQEGNYKFWVDYSELSAIRLFIFPKFKLQFATDRYNDMLAMRNLCITDSVTDVHNALDPDMGVYSVREHTYLRQNFTCVFVTADNHVYDTHYDAVKFVGHTEFSFFARGLP